MAASSPVASWDWHRGLLLVDWNRNGCRGRLHVAFHTGDWGCAGRGYDRSLEMIPPSPRRHWLRSSMRWRKVMENLGLEPKPETGVAASSVKPPSGFVQAEAPTPAQTPQTLEKETLTLHGGSDHRDLHHRRLGTLGSGPTSLCCQILQRHYAWWAAFPVGRFPQSPWTAPLWSRSQRCITSRSARLSTHRCWNSGTLRSVGAPWWIWKRRTPGTSPQLVCSDCSAPWGKLSKCLLCQGSQPVDLSVTPLSVIEVAGQSWQLRLTEAGPTLGPNRL